MRPIRYPTPRALRLGLVLLTCVAAQGAVIHGDDVPRYELWETTLTNTRSYGNKFDHREIELRGRFIRPDGSSVDWVGFHDGDGSGGQNGNVWRIRFMPDATGTWQYRLSFSDGTAIADASGSFRCVSSSRPGKLRIDPQRSWWFETSRGTDFHARPYGMHHVGHDLHDASWTSASGSYRAVFDDHLLPGGFNMAMIDSPSNTGHGRCYWYGATKDVFDVAVFRDYERILADALAREIYVFPFDGAVAQGDKGLYTPALRRYLAARFAPFACYMGFSPTWEWTDLWGASTVDNAMQEIAEVDAFGTLLSAHDHLDSSFADWAGFAQRQIQSDTVFDGNDRLGGKHGGTEIGGIPVIGSEDIWVGATYDNPATELEVARGAWGILLGGAIPMYSEWHNWADNPGSMPGEDEVRRMFDFVYGRGDYRRWRPLNGLVSSSAGQVCAGIAGEEYCVYDQGGGGVAIDLGAAGGASFAVTWFDPLDGTVRDGGSVDGGARRNLSSPFSGDWVLLLERSGNSEPEPDPQAPSVAFSQPSDGAGFQAPADIGVVVAASDSDGSVVSVALYIDGSLVRTERYAPYEWGGANANETDPAISDLAAGTYVLRAIATDDDGLTSASEITISVSSPASEPPPSDGVTIDNLTVASGEAYQVATLAVGSELYIDRPYTVSDLVEASWDGALQIRTANDDKNASGPGFLRFDLSAAAVVHVAYDERAGSRPAWLDGWSDTGITIATSDVGFRVFSRSFAAGTVSLGGNEAGTTGAGSMYWVFVPGGGATPPPAPSRVAITFQPGGAPTVDGWLVDDGAAYGDRGDGLSYGWDGGNGATRDRNVDPDQLRDTLNHLQKSGDRRWELAMADGLYEVRIQCGDPAYSDQVNHLSVEGQRIADPDGQDHFDQHVVTVEVTDGRLTLLPAADAMNAKICWIEVTPLGSNG